MGMIDTLVSKFAATANQYVISGGTQGILEGSGKHTNRYVLNENTNGSYFDFLETYHFASSLTNLLSSIAIEAFEHSKLEINVKKCQEDVIRGLNDVLQSSNIKSKLIEDMPRIMWRGKYAYGLDSNKGNLIDIRNPFDIKCVTRLGDVIGYVYQNKYFKVGDMVGYWYDRYPIKPIKSSIKMDELIEKDGGKTPLMKYFVEFATFSGKSIFSDQLIRIFQCYCLEYILYMISIRDSIKPEMLSLTYGSKLGDLAYGTNASKQLESLLNAPTMSLANIVEPISFVNSLTASLLNYIKVIPNIDTYDGTRAIDYPDMQAKKQKVTEDYDNAKKQVLNNLTIPEELYSGTANRWEAVGRNDRFMTTNQRIVGSISRFVKYYAKAMLKKKWNLDVKIADIDFNIDISNFTSMYDIKAKISAISDKLQTIEQLSMSFNNLIQNYPWMSKDKLTDYVLKQVAVVDTDLKDVINKDAIMNPPPPPLQDTDKDGIPDNTDPSPFGQYRDGTPVQNPDAAMRKEMREKGY